MNRTRRLVRLYLLMIVIILLPLGGFLWSVPGHQLYVALIAAACLVLITCTEAITLLTEREALAMQLKLIQEAEDLSEWKEKVRDLERIVGMISRENDEFRRVERDRSLHPARPAPPPP